MTEVQENVDRKADLALKLSHLVHDLCQDVPHDIGLKLADVVDQHFYGTTTKEVVEALALRHMVRQWCHGHCSADRLREFFGGMDVE